MPSSDIVRDRFELFRADRSKRQSQKTQTDAGQQMLNRLCLYVHKTMSILFCRPSYLRREMPCVYVLAVYIVPGTECDIASAVIYDTVAGIETKNQMQLL